jgi:hypothetical protein
MNGVTGTYAWFLCVSRWFWGIWNSLVALASAHLVTAKNVEAFSNAAITQAQVCR